MSGSEPVSLLERLDPDVQLPSGLSQLIWRATRRDPGGRSYSSTRSQTVRIYPLLEFEADRTVSEGSTLTVMLRLSGPAPRYPVELSWLLSGSAVVGDDYLISPSSNELLIAAGALSAQIIVHVIDDGIADDAERVVLTLDSARHAALGGRRRYTASVLEGNQPPAVRLHFTQRPSRTDAAEMPLGNTLYNNLSFVTMRAVVSDPDVGDAHQFRWHTQTPGLLSGFPDLSALSEGEFNFDPVNLSADLRRIGDETVLTGGVRHIGVEVTDSQGASISVSRWFTVLRVENIAQHAETGDSDNNGIADGFDALGDADADGIPNFADDPTMPARAIPVATNLPDVVEVDQGMQIALGRISLATSLIRGVYGIGSSRDVLEQTVSLGAAAPDIADLIADGNRLATNYLYDFVVTGLRPGGAANIIIPLRNALTQDAEYRKYRDDRWHAFVDDGALDGGNGALYTAPGGASSCPAPFSLLYRPGLNQFDRCLRLTIRDGGANDADGVANGVIEDPGGIVVPVTVSPDDSSAAASPRGGGALAPWMALALLALLAAAPRAAKAGMVIDSGPRRGRAARRVARPRRTPRSPR